ncbi:head-tail adaptor protein [Bradyrhizobium barranii subsp. barranii]|uniref:Head-tail adaptor protein n=1 Tax=Bradyrhizobium barranii subsp. barranii TaxID=2823807 RepID=A0A939M8Y4_9BRAD|nr:head-tail adaptor protein [Bradyrhizobium barranii]UEM09018.1 head-tail adaptor protein [Bradyrhizobium barranii subsp. barranii]
MSQAGALRHRIAFDRREDVDDGYGNTQSEFVEQFVVWAGVEARFGGETVTAARLSGQQPLTITVRRSEQTARIKTDWQARDTRTGETYNIRSIADPTDAGAFLELLCQAGVAT